MKLPRPSSRETPPHSRPPRGTDVLRGIEDEVDDGIEFDPKRDITEKDWEGMMGKIEEYRRDKDWFSFVGMAAPLLTVSPEHKAALNLNGEVFEGTRKTLNACRESDLWSFVDFAVDVVLLFPDRKSELNIGDDVFQELKGELKVYRNLLHADDFIIWIYSALRLFPDRILELGLDHQTFEWIKNELKTFGRGNSTFREYAVYVSLLFPERKNELKIGGEDFDWMRRILAENRGRDWQSFSVEVRDMTILAAEDARITPDGQILITPKKPKLSKAPPPLPERSRV